MNACVEARGHQIDAAVIGGDVEYNVRVVARELSQLRRQEQLDGTVVDWMEQVNDEQYEGR